MYTFFSNLSRIFYYFIGNETTHGIPLEPRVLGDDIWERGIGGDGVVSTEVVLIR
jgi:hypothetical protein